MKTCKKLKETGNKKEKLFGLLLLIIICFAACSDKQDTTDKGSMNIDFDNGKMVKSGTEYYTYQVEEGSYGIVSINISKESGCLDIDVYRADEEGEPDYTGRDLDSMSFEVRLKQPGEYKVLVTAKKFVGDYDISWKTEDKAEEEAATN